MARRSQFRSSRQRGGYVLIVVLFVLVIAAAALAGACRSSLQRTLLVHRMETDLQRRWGVTTCRAVLLPKAALVLNRAERPTSEARQDIVLGGQTLTLVFGDEQAKANVNALHRRGGLVAVDRAVRSFAGSSERLSIDLRPLPARRPTDAGDEPAAYESFGQLFAARAPDALVEGTSVAANLTCWGDGSIHFRGASDDVLCESCRGQVGGAEIAKMLQLRAKNPKADASEILDELTLSTAAREALEEILVDDSTCHSLWIITRTGDRNSYDLAVADDSNEEAQTLTFSW